MKLRFQYKKGVGGHWVGRRRLIPGEIIECEKWELGNAPDKFEQLDPDPEPQPAPSEAQLIITPRGAGDLAGFDVINQATGGPINDRPLTSREAESMATGEPVVDETMPSSVETKSPETETKVPEGETTAGGDETKFPVDETPAVVEPPEKTDEPPPDHGAQADAPEPPETVAHNSAGPSPTVVPMQALNLGVRAKEQRKR